MLLYSDVCKVTEEWDVTEGRKPGPTGNDTREPAMGIREGGRGVAKETAAASW